MKYFNCISFLLAGTIISSMWKEGKFCCAPIKTVRADPLISAIGSFCAVPFMFGGFYLLGVNVPLAWISIFLAIAFLCLNWAINVDMLMVNSGIKNILNYLISVHHRAAEKKYGQFVEHSAVAFVR